MTWQVPTWWAFVLLALAAYRAWRLLAEDEILDAPRDRIAPEESRRSSFIACPYCLGAWVSLAWWLAWAAWPHWTLVVATPFAISGLVALIAANLDAD